MGKEVLQDAEEIVSQYATKKFSDALKRVDKEMHKKGCGCRSCKVRAAEEANSWADFVGGEGFAETDYAEKIKFRINNKGNIYQGEEEASPDVDY